MIANIRIEIRATKAAPVASLAASEVGSIAPISILMLAIDSASQKTCKKTYYMPK